ncbi:MAG: hypothetical protein ABIV25_08475 [Paracoccaceae bacterium]
MTQTYSERSNRSALWGIILGLTAACRALAGEMHNRWAVARSLGRLSPQALRDFDLTRGDLDAARSAPLSQDMATQLYIKAQLRPSNW